MVSDRVRITLDHLCDGDLEFLPVQKLMGREYFAVNVLRMEDVLDLERCDLTLVDNKIASIRTFAFHIDLPRSLPPIFKTPQATGDIFVTDQFKNTVLRNGFTGLALADPASDNFAKTVRGMALNVVSGIIE